MSKICFSIKMLMLHQHFSNLAWKSWFDVTSKKTEFDIVLIKLVTIFIRNTSGEINAMAWVYNQLLLPRPLNQCSLESLPSKVNDYFSTLFAWITICSNIYKRDNENNCHNIYLWHCDGNFLSSHTTSIFFLTLWCHLLLDTLWNWFLFITLFCWF